MDAKGDHRKMPMPQSDHDIVCMFCFQCKVTGTCDGTMVLEWIKSKLRMKTSIAKDPRSCDMPWG